MKTIKNLFAVVAFLLVASCSSNDDTTPEDPEVFPQEITPVLIAHRVLFNNFPDIAPERTNIIIDNDTDWADFVTTMGTEVSHFSETDIDFGEFQVIALFDYYAGGSGVEDVEVTSVIEHEQHITTQVQYTESEENSCFGHTGTTERKYYIIKITKSPKPIQFENSIVIPECPESPSGANFAIGIKKETPISEVFNTLNDLDFEIRKADGLSYFYNNATPEDVDYLIDLFSQKIYMSGNGLGTYVVYEESFNRIKISFNLYNMNLANQTDFLGIISSLELEDQQVQTKIMYLVVPDGTEAYWTTQMMTYPFVNWAEEL